MEKAFITNIIYEAPQPSHKQHCNMVDNAGKNQRTADVKGGDPGCPLKRMRFSVGCAERHEAGNVEGAGSHESQRLRFADGAGHGPAEHRIVRRHIKSGAEGRIHVIGLTPTCRAAARHRSF